MARDRRFTKAGTEKATRTQIDLIRDLAERAGYSGDRGYAAAEDLLGDGRGWADTPQRAQLLIDALSAKLGDSVSVPKED